MKERIAVFGGVYSNYLALQAALADMKRRGLDALYCLGDMGAFGPYPDRVFPLLWQAGVQCIQGNYDHAISNDLPDCQCGYTDPKDNYFAALSYRYTYDHTSTPYRDWLRQLPEHIQVMLGPYRLLMCHGSPRRMNEFLWESTCPDHFLHYLLDRYTCDVLLVTHTGIKWHRQLAGDRHVINVGAIGRPENDGRTCVWYTVVEVEHDALGGDSLRRLRVEFLPVAYDYQRLAADMRAERLPEEFIETIVTGWGTTCLEILPSKERKRGKY
ncbi:MAG: metallophosphoesterase [Gemmataceae bacterium]